MDRRHFLEMTGLLSGALLLSPATVLARREDAIRIGIIGCGDRGQGIMQMMASLKDQYAITAICDILDFRLDTAAKLAPAKSYKDYRRLLEAKDVDAVVIATSLHMHYTIAADAIRAGKSVYLEKTMTYNLPEAQQLVKLCARYPGQILAVGHQYRYTPLYFKVKEMISKGYLGDVTQIDCRWDRNWNWRRPVPAGYSDEQINWRMYKRYSGGLPAELLSHQMDFINWAFDTHPDEVMGTGGIDHFNDGRETYDNVQVLLRYKEKGMIGNFGATCANAHEGYIFKIKGTKGMVSLLPDKGVFYPEEAAKKELQTVDGVSGATRLEWNTDGGVSIVNEKMQDGTWYALKEFYNSVKTGTQPVSNVKTGATTAVCVHLANEAIFTHKILPWKPEYNF